MRKFYMNAISVLAVVALPMIGSGQSYDFTLDSNQSYQNLVGSTSLNNATVWDDPEYSIPIGFDFVYSDTTYSTLGIAGLGALVTFNSSFTGPTPIILPFQVDVIDFGTDSPQGSQSNISHLTEGTAGSRIFKLEWNNAGFYGDWDDDGVCTDFVNFQLWLYEGSNIVEMHYGPNSVLQPSLSYEGSTGAAVGVLPYYDGTTDESSQNSYMLTGAPTSPVSNAQTGSLDILYLDGTIPNGMVYRFTPNNIGLNEVQALEIDIYPNPATDVIFVKSVSSVVSVELLNVNGQTIQQLDLGRGNQVDVSFLPAGMYMMRILDAEGNQAKQRFIKQ